MTGGEDRAAGPEDVQEPDEPHAFAFACLRSGRCCRVQGGIRFLASGEAAALAADLDLDEAAFAARYVTARVHPDAGDLRDALRDRPDGACVLLEGHNTCRAYDARPASCRDFPAWGAILEDRAGFERARSLCPGLEALPEGAERGPSGTRTFRLRFGPREDR